MLYKVTIEPEYLKAELFNRETMEETREFLQIVAGAATRYQRSSGADLCAFLEPGFHGRAVWISRVLQETQRRSIA